MNIIIEGPDASGKTTLAKGLSQELPFTLKSGEGIERYPGEIIERIKRYLSMDDMIFDRHPIISQFIYNQFRENGTPIPQELIDKFYSQDNIIIYCYGIAGPHEPKEYDSEEHLSMINRFEDNIRNAYEEWAPGRAHMRFSVKDGNVNNIIDIIREMLS